MHIKNTKSKVLISIVSVSLMSLAIFGVCRLVQLVGATSAGNLGLVDRLMQGTTVNYGGNRDTSQYEVVYDANHGVITNHAMCAMPSKDNVVEGRGNIYGFSPSGNSTAEEAVKVLLATDSNYGGSAYGGTLGQDIADLVLGANGGNGIRINSSPSLSATMFAVGHMVIGVVLSDLTQESDPYFGLNVNERAVVDNIRATISNWYSANPGVTDWQGYDLMLMAPNNTSYQAVTWLEPNGGSVNPDPDDPPVTTGTTIVINKHSTDPSKTILPGTQFELMDQSNNNITTVTLPGTSITMPAPSASGSWCIREITPPSGFVIGSNGTWQCQDDMVGGGTLTFNVYDDPETPTPTTGTIRIYKEDEDGVGLPGAKFYLATESDKNSGNTSNYQVIDMTSTDEITISNVEEGSWCVLEIQAPDNKHQMDTNWHCNPLGAGGTLAFHIVNRSIPDVSGSVTIKKIDADTGTTTPSGGASLAGAVFQVDSCSDATCGSSSYYGQITIGTNGIGSLSNLPEGHYQVWEYQAGTGYVTDTSVVKKFSITSASPDVDLSSSPFVNTAKKSNIIISKQRIINNDENNVVTVSNPEPFQGVSFGIYYGSNPNYNVDTPVATITTGSDGAATTQTALPYGTYTVHEVQNNVNMAFRMVEDRIAEITSDGQLIEVGSLTNNLLDTPTLTTSAREAGSSIDNPVRELENTTNASIKDVVTYNNNGQTLTSGLSYKACGEVYGLIGGTTNLLTTQPVCETWIQSDGKTNVELMFDGVDTTGVAGGSVSIMTKLYVINNGESLILAIHNANLDEPTETLSVNGITGSLIIKKVDADTMTTVPSGGASLVGAKFAVDRCSNGNNCDSSNSEGWSRVSEKQLTSSDGILSWDNLPEGYYKVYETQAGNGYVLNTNNKTFSITNDGQIVDFSANQADWFANTVIKGSIKITKKRTINDDVNDVMTSTTELFQGVTFEIYHNSVVSSNLVDTVTTGSNGIATTMTLPFGTYIIKEKVPTDGKWPFRVIDDKMETITENGAVVEVELTNELLNSPTLTTIAREGSSTVENPVRELNATTSASIKDRVIFGNSLTDGLDYEVCGDVYEVTSRTLLTATPSCVTWTQNGQTEVEVPFNGIDTTQLIGKNLSIIQKMYVKNGNERLLLVIHNADLNELTETLSVSGVTIETQAWRTGAIGKNRNIYASTNSGVSDVVSMLGLATNTDYTLNGEIYVLNEQDGIVTLGEKVATISRGFTTGEMIIQGAVEETMNFALDTVGLIGKKLVVFEYLYIGDVLIGQHAEIADGNQIVTVMTPIIDTKAIDAASDGNDDVVDNVIEAANGQVIRDIVSYENLKPGDYYLCGILMDKNTGNVLKINGVEVAEKCAVVTASGETGSFTMDFAVDASGLPGASIVVFEALHEVIYNDAILPDEEDFEPLMPGVVIARHNRIDAGDQTVKVKSRIGTKAVDDYDGDQEVGVGNATIVDTVEYEGLSAGTYIMIGELMDIDGTKVTGTGVKAETTFIVKDEDLINGLASGEVEMKFEVDTRAYWGRKLVVFEELYLMAEPNVWIAEHKEKDDPDQTVAVAEPTIKTTASDAADEDKELSPNAKVKIRDRVAYTGLVPGTTYTLKGTLMDKKTGKVLLLGNGREAEEVTLAFTPDRDEGVVRMEFEIPTATLEGKEIVVFEVLYIGEETADGEKLTVNDIIAVHRDIDDEKQTVAVGIAPKVPDTGLNEQGQKSIGIDNNVIILALGVVGIGALAMWHVRRKNKVDLVARK